MAQLPPHAVITGDLIQSRAAGASATDQAFDTLQHTASDFGQARGLDLRLTRHRGDGWQILLPQPQLTLETVLFFIASLRAGPAGLRSRMAIGIGPIENAGTADLSDAQGAAFTRSGHLIDTLSPKRSLGISGPDLPPALTAIIDLSEHITAGWTAPQAQAVAYALRNYPQTHDKVAFALGITRQAVQSRLASAGLAYFQTAITAFRDYDF